MKTTIKIGDKNYPVETTKMGNMFRTTPVGIKIFGAQWIEAQTAKQSVDEMGRWMSDLNDRGTLPNPPKN